MPPAPRSPEGSVARSPSGSSGFGRHWKVLVATLVFLAFAPLGLISVPLTFLLAVSRPRRAAEVALLAIAAGMSLGWLLAVGRLPEQVARAGALFAAAAFVVLARRTAASVVHRAIASVGAAAVAVALWLPLIGRSWAELHWWVEQQAGRTARVLLRAFWVTTPTGPAAPEFQAGRTAEQLGGWLDGSVQFLADYYPAVLALEIVGGLAIATALHHRLASRPFGTAVGRLRDFRFNEHIGWIAVLAVLVLLAPFLDALRVGAANVLLVMVVCYAIRGLGVAAHGLSLLNGGSALTLALAVLAALLLLPIVVGGIILLGVIDARLDLRRRWPTSSNIS